MEYNLRSEGRSLRSHCSEICMQRPNAKDCPFKGCRLLDFDRNFRCFCMHAFCLRPVLKNAVAGELCMLCTSSAAGL